MNATKKRAITYIHRTTFNINELALACKMRGQIKKSDSEKLGILIHNLPSTNRLKTEAVTGNEKGATAFTVTP